MFVIWMNIFLKTYLQLNHLNLFPYVNYDVCCLEILSNNYELHVLNQIIFE